MDKIKITMDIVHPGQGLHFALRVDGQVEWHTHDTHDGSISIDIDDDENTHVLEMVMDGKKSHHTRVSSTGEIEQDVVIAIKNLAFDGIALGHTLIEKAVYLHDHNGTTSPRETQFFGTMGCNGTVRLTFTTPIYLWLLENT